MKETINKRTFWETTEIDARGYVTELIIEYTPKKEIENCTIRGIKVVDNDKIIYGEEKGHCPKYNRDMYDESGITWAEAAHLLRQQILSGQEIENVKGARYLSEDIREMKEKIDSRFNNWVNK